MDELIPLNPTCWVLERTRGGHCCGCASELLLETVHQKGTGNVHTECLVVGFFLMEEDFHLRFCLSAGSWKWGRWLGQNRHQLKHYKIEWLWILQTLYILRAFHLLFWMGLHCPKQSQCTIWWSFWFHSSCSNGGTKLQLHWLLPFLDQEGLLMVTHVLVSSQVYFFNALFAELLLKSIQKLLEQNVARCTVMGTSQAVWVTTLQLGLISSILPISVQRSWRPPIKPFMTWGRITCETAL